jgi:hypothetical protein
MEALALAARQLLSKTDREIAESARSVFAGKLQVSMRTFAADSVLQSLPEIAEQRQQKAVAELAPRGLSVVTFAIERAEGCQFAGENSNRWKPRKFNNSLVVK